MNAHALTVRQFHRVLDVVAGHASSSLGAARVRASEPAGDIGLLERELTRVAALRTLVASDEGWIQHP